MTKGTLSKETHYLDQTLDAIWRRGDRDEQSIKHIGHAVAAIVAFGNWRGAIDYTLPENWWSEDERVNEYRRDHLTKMIDPFWKKVTARHQKLGTEKFLELLQESKFGFYPLSYLEDDYLPYAKKLTQKQKFS